MPATRILLFVKYPEPGHVKTRLAATLGDDAAVSLYRAFVTDEIIALSRAAVPVTICFDPARSEGDYRAWLGPGFDYIPQRGPDLGARMANAFADIFTTDCTRAILIGSDLPSLTPDDITRATAALDRTGTALTPSGDGGYTLIAFTRDTFTPAVFLSVPWSTEDVLPATIARFREAALPLALLPELPDADTEADLRALSDRFADAPESGPQHTLAALRELF